MLSVEGSVETGFWIQKGPGVLKLTGPYPTFTAAVRELPMYGRLYHDRELRAELRYGPAS